MKYNLQRATEEGVHVVLDKYIVVQEADLKILKSHAPFVNEAYIYLICQRPRLFVNPNSLVVTTESIFMTFGKQEGKNWVDKLRVSHPNTFGRTDLMLESDFPDTFFSIKTSDDEVVHSAKASAWIDHWGLSSQEKGLLDLKVLYVGQGTSNNAADRVERHETIQKIHAHTSAHHPDTELWLFMATFHKDKNHIGVKGDVKLTDEQEKRDYDRFLNLIINGGSRFSKRQRINLIEATLIRYFEPAYNDKFVKTFPSRSHTSYSEYYAADINSILVELDTTELCFQLYSAKAPKQDYHRFSFYLPKRSGRYGLFEE